MAGEPNGHGRQRRHGAVSTLAEDPIAATWESFSTTRTPAGGFWPSGGLASGAVADERISLSEAARRSGVPASTLKRWAEEKIVPVRRGRWTATAAAQARVVARMRERGHSLEDLKSAGREGRLAFGFTEELFSDTPETVPLAEVAEETGLEPELIDRILAILGTPTGRREELTHGDAAALRHCARVLAAGFPLVAFLQLARVYVQSMRRIADAEVRLFHLYVHEPLIRDAVPELQIAEEMGDLAADVLPLAAPLTEYLHIRYLRYFIEQDVVGHMESGLGADTAEIELGQVMTTLCFIDLTGFTRYTEEEGDLEALDVVENFVETVESTLPREATIVKTIGDEVMVVSPDAPALTEWAVELLQRLPERPQPRVGIHFGEAVYRDGDYFGGQVNLAHRVVGRALAGEVLVTDRVCEAIAGRENLSMEPIGQVSLKGFPSPTDLFLVRAASSKT
jgi:adenylate cyclase